jgi:tetratricopeptide (TPR) repeat protein
MCRSAHHSTNDDVGDPLCAPFRNRSLAPVEIDRGLGSGNRTAGDIRHTAAQALSVAAYKKAGIHPDTIKLILRAEARLAKQDQAGAHKALEQAVKRDNRLPGLQFLLASLYEAAQEYDRAIEQYSRLLELSPENPLYLNNLAYALAVRKNSIQEALRLAEKAFSLAKENPGIADTLGWIYHLSGQNKKAAKPLEEAAKAAPQNAEMHLYFAVVIAAAGNKLASQAALQRALEIDPEMDRREEVKQLRLGLKD